MNKQESNNIIEETESPVLKEISDLGVIEQEMNNQESNVIIEENNEAVLEKNSDLRLIQSDEESEVNSSLNKERLICEGNDNIQGNKTLITPRFTDDLKVILLEEEKVVDGLTSSYFFPALRDPGISISILENVTASKKKSECGAKEKYEKVCKCLEVAPITSFYESFSRNEVDLGFYGLNTKGVQAMADALRSNSFIRVLNLEDNHFTNEAVYHLREMLRVNVTISELNLKGCKIGQKGAETLALGIHANTSLKLLNLADNCIEDDGMKFLAKTFLEHSGLKNIILSGNNLFKKSAVRLGRMLEENCILEKLDLSWNHLNSKEGCEKLFAGLKVNTSLECFDISWNGLNELAAGPLAECLSKNKILWYLDISNNSFNDDDVIVLGEGLKNNASIKQLKIGMNFFNHNGAMSLLTSLRTPKLPIEILDFQNVIVEKEFKKLLTEVLKVRKVQVLFGGYKSDYQVKGPEMKELLLKRAKFLAQKPKKRPKDFGLQRKQVKFSILRFPRKNGLEKSLMGPGNFFQVYSSLGFFLGAHHLGQFILKLEDKPLKKEEFQLKLNEAKIKLDKHLVGEILEAFKVDKEFNTKELKDYYLKLFPDTKLVMKAKKVKSKSKKGKKLGKTGAKSTKK